MDWTGRELFDANGAIMGVIAGAGYRRRRFGVAWLVIETPSGDKYLVPGDDVRQSGDRLVLPYPRGYVETGPPLQGDGSLGAEGERRLRLHYGVGKGIVGGHCKGCGLCMTTARAKAAESRMVRGAGSDHSA